MQTDALLQRPAIARTIQKNREDDRKVHPEKTYSIT